MLKLSGDLEVRRVCWAIARTQGGGGHRQAAGFTTEMSHDELVSFLREEIKAQL